MLSPKVNKYLQRFKSRTSVLKDPEAVKPWLKLFLCVTEVNTHTNNHSDLKPKNDGKQNTDI